VPIDTIKLNVCIDGLDVEVDGPSVYPFLGDDIFVSELFAKKLSILNLNLRRPLDGIFEHGFFGFFKSIFRERVIGDTVSLEPRGCSLFDKPFNLKCFFRAVPFQVCSSSFGSGAWGKKRRCHIFPVSFLQGFSSLFLNLRKLGRIDNSIFFDAFLFSRSTQLTSLFVGSMPTILATKCKSGLGFADTGRLLFVCNPTSIAFKDVESAASLACGSVFFSERNLTNFFDNEHNNSFCYKYLCSTEKL